MQIIVKAWAYSYYNAHSAINDYKYLQRVSYANYSFGQKIIFCVSFFYSFHREIEQVYWQIKLHSRKFNLWIYYY